MKVTFILSDLFALYNIGTTNKRSITIELTPDQIEKVKPREVGTDRGKKMYEVIEQVFIDE